MREKILDLLVCRAGEFISGEELSKLLGISRAGVWKHIEHLREEGYRIESQTKLGHRLLRGAKPVNRYELQRNLKTAQMGTKFVVLKEAAGSTNDVAKDLARQGAASGTVVVAEKQLGGRGRRGRAWSSPEGGVWMSIILRPNLELKDAACYTLLAGVAVAKAIRNVTGVQAGLKWPNDVVVNGKKVGGILTEVSAEWQMVEFLVIGIGINANLTADYLPVETDATSLRLVAGKQVDRVDLIQDVLLELERTEGCLKDEGVAGIIEEWRRLAVCLNCHVIVKEQEREWVGHSQDIAPDGALIVLNECGQEVKLYSGDVSLRGQYGSYNF